MSVPQMFTDQFEQAPVRGDLDLAITKSGVITGTLTSVSGAVQVGSVYAGDRVKLDATVTTPGQVAFVPAADTDDAIGVVKRVAKKAAFVVGDVIEVAYFGGPVQYHVAGATVTPGMQLELLVGYTQELDTKKFLGICLDYAVANTMHRVILMPVNTLA